ncbi:MAG: hypothetical protein ABIJ56_09360 [Pseudomonadota bacterium]
MSKQKASRSTLLFPVMLAAAAVLSAGCKSKSYAFVDVPFCASDDPGQDTRFAHEYRLLVKHSNGYMVSGLSHGMSTPNRLSPVSREKILIALVRCPDADVPPINAVEAMKEFSEKKIPEVCKGQKTMVHGRLEAEQSARASALGYGGFFHFPKVDLPCRGGKMTQDNLYTFGQIMDSFKDSVNAFAGRHGRLPGTFAELQKETLADPLPKDPWGSPLAFKREGDKVLLVCSGPDKKQGTGDDRKILEMSGGSSTNALGFEDADMPPGVGYKAFLESRGIDSD